jgi:hypothetical protein
MKQLMHDDILLKPSWFVEERLRERHAPGG